jgi:hypothetical protein
MNPDENIIGTPDPELYRYGYHAHDFWVNVTVGPGKYDVRLKFATTRGLDTRQNCFDILINGETVVHNIDITATAGGPNKAVDLVFRNIGPRNGVIQIRFKGSHLCDGDKSKRGQAFVQALEIGQNPGGKGAEPVTVDR